MIDTIACVLKTSREYDVDYVEMLVSSIKRYGDTNVDIVCVSDNKQVEKYCDYLPLERGLDGWWNKLELFSHPGLSGRSVLYFDLDTVIRGSFSHVLQHDHTFTMLQDFMYPHRLASGVLAFSGDHSNIGSTITQEELNTYVGKNRNVGDQAYIEDHVTPKVDKFQDLFPDTFCSYKVHKDSRRKFPVVCFHGRPRPRQVNWNVEC